MSLAIAYGMKKRGKKMASGGMCEHGKSSCEMCHGGKMAEGGEPIHEDLDYTSMPGDSRRGHSRAGQDVRESNRQKGYGDPDSLKRAERAMGDAKKAHKSVLNNMKNQKKPNLYAEGGPVEEDDRMMNQHGSEEVGAEGMFEDNEPQHERMASHPLENQNDHEDMVGRIMRQRQQHFSEGGRVANKTSKSADFEPNEFDQLVKGDDLEQHYTGQNSGDELGNAREDHDREDIVARIMKQRRMRDRTPSPA